MSTTQDEIYNILKKHRGVRFTRAHLVKLMKANASTLKNILSRMIKNKSYPRLVREYRKKTATNGREFICYVYFVR